MPRKGEIDREKQRYWQGVMADFERSGLSGQAYCRANGISYTAFADRRRRRSSQRQAHPRGCAPKNPKAVPFAELRVSDDTKSRTSDIVAGGVGTALEIVLPSGITIRMASPSMLSTVLPILESM